MKNILPAMITLLLIAAPAEAAKKPIPPGGFKSCKEALAAGYSHMKKGEPGYSKNLDRDGDGVACDKVGNKRK